MRNGDTYARLAAGFGIGVATVYRYIREALDLLAATAPTTLSIAPLIDRERSKGWLLEPAAI